MIQGLDLYKKYGQVEVLKGVSIDIPPSSVTSIVGASGAGKSTLIHLLGTLEKPDNGRVIIRGIEVSSLKESKLAAFRNKHIGFVFQFHHLLPEFTALENICIPAFIAGTTKSEAEKKGLELLDVLNISARANHKPNELSGGEQQRVAVARALINHPDVVFADEPSGNLDSANAKDLHNLFFTLRDTLQQTFVIVTHNEELAGLADRVIHMKDGNIV